MFLQKKYQLPLTRNDSKRVLKGFFESIRWYVFTEQFVLQTNFCTILKGDLFMTREERVKAALKGEAVDRVPVSVWMHFSEHDQDPRALAETQTAFNEEYDYDFIKMMPFGTYSVQDWGAQIKIYCDKYKEPIVAKTAVDKIEDYKRIQALPAYYGTWGKQVQFAQHMARMIKPHTPFIQTLFSPATTLRKLVGERMFTDMKENPEYVTEALQNITETTIHFVKANIEIGVSGFFLASQCASYDLFNEEEYKKFVMPYDLEVMKSYCDKTYFNVVHMHGENIMFDIINENYPCNCLNWHDRHTKPDFKEARTKSDKCFLGGIQEVPFFVNGVLTYDSIMQRSTPEQIETHIKEAIALSGTNKLILGPGCVTDPKTSDANLRAVRKAVEGSGTR